MFKIDRRATPKWMQSREFVQVGELLADFHAKGGTRGLQERFPLELELAPFNELILEALRDQFDGLCAYSEVASDPGRDDPPHRLLWHRPTNDAASLDGKVDFEHYWWLTLDWDNWYLASAFIESVKSYQFPVVGNRMPVDARGALDTGVLLDPCQDEPTWWLDFGHDGRVSPRQHPSPAEQERFDMRRSRGADDSHSRPRQPRVAFRPATGDTRPRVVRTLEATRARRHRPRDRRTTPSSSSAPTAHHQRSGRLRIGRA